MGLNEELGICDDGGSGGVLLSGSRERRGCRLFPLGLELLEIVGGQGDGL